MDKNMNYMVLSDTERAATTVINIISLSINLRAHTHTKVPGTYMN